MKANNLNKKERLYNKAIKKAEERQKQGFHEDAALAWLEAATLLPQKEDPEAIENCLDKAGFTSDSTGEYLKAELACVLKNLGNVYYEKGELDKAESYFQHALIINEKILNNIHPDIVSILKDLGNVYYEKNDLDNAELYFQRALTISEKILTKEHPDIASILNNLGCVYYEKNNLDKAESHFQRAFIIRNKLLGKDYPNTDKVLVSGDKELNYLLNARAVFHQTNLAKMATMITHYINHPVTIVRTIASTALSNKHKLLFNPATELQPLLEDVVEKAEQINIMVSNFKNFLSGDRTIMTSTNLNTLINDVCQLIFDSSYQSDTIELIKAFTEPAPIAYTNEFSLQEVLISLLNNAREALKNKSIKTVRISTWQEKNKIGITIEDSSNGIDKEQLYKLATPLLISKDDSRSLDLYFCKEICQELGGDISYHPASQGGAVFRITLQEEKNKIG